ncbi:OmpH family outer membrane protein [Dysgonomonas sp. Marseille-P4361]|uniref:OmpH family outer membrane protein n=1 Tax=Dysgonomonas sp. Marseille-P4361 TaxID=2161820 RepID=UPI000D54D8BE|nr:OmpH family outer membrane protein [Dysgonomonas sp. Marseille-P4361]
MFKKLILLLFIVAPITIFAQDKIAYINSQEIFSKMPELKDIETQLNTEGETIQKRSAEIEAEYTALAEKFQKDTTELTESLIQDRQAQLAALEQRYRSYVQTSSQEFEKKRQQLLEPVQQKMVKAIKDVGNENNYTYILDEASLLHIGANAINANALVKAKLGITN